MDPPVVARQVAAGSIPSTKATVKMDEMRWKPRQEGMLLHHMPADRRPNNTTTEAMSCFNPATIINGAQKQGTTRRLRHLGVAVCLVTGAEVLQLQANLCSPVQQQITHVHLITAMVTYFALVPFTHFLCFLFLLVGKTVTTCFITWRKRTRLQDYIWSHFCSGTFVTHGWVYSDFTSAVLLLM